MSQVEANGITLEYDEFGPATGTPLILIMGLGMQMIAWPEPFCALLGERGFRVIRFDNRDIGLSSKWAAPRFPGFQLRLTAAILRLPLPPPYTLDDMAADTVGLLDALKIPRAHIVGASMGGMIAQIVAANFPERVISLVSMMSSTSRRGLPGPSAKVRRGLMARRPQGREEVIHFGMNVLRLIGSPGYPTPEADLRRKVERFVDRAYCPAGFGRQLLAVIAAPNRVRLLRRVRAPTLVLHGQSDPLLSLKAAEDTAAQIPDARLTTIAGWGHDIAPGLVPRLADEIASHCATAEAAEASAPGGKA